MAGDNGTQRDIGRLEGMAAAQGQKIDEIAAAVRLLTERGLGVQATVAQLARTVEKFERIDAMVDERLERLERAEQTARLRRARTIGFIAGVSAVTSLVTTGGALLSLDKLRIIFHTTQVVPANER